MSSISRRTFFALSAGLPALAAGLPGLMLAAHADARTQQSRTLRVRPGGHDGGFDPWLEIIGDAFRHNAREVSRLAGGRPILAVVKNNAYGMGDSIVGPLLASCREIGGVACVRPAEALAMRTAGVRKPMLLMSETSEDEGVELARHDVTLSCWLDDAAERLERVARKARKTVSVQYYVDTGMNREGMPWRRAIPWMQQIAQRRGVRVDGTYQMFVHELEFNRVQLQRFTELIDEAKARGVRLGTLHAAPTFELYRMPEAHLDMVRVGNALFGADPGSDYRSAATLQPVFRLKARVVRVERLEPGESASFRRSFQPHTPTSIALLPVGHTDGYPATAGGTCEVLIGGRRYPVVNGGVASAHTIVDVGADPAVRVGDEATLIGPEDAAITPHEVATRTKVGFYAMITRFSALLPRRQV